MNYMIADIEDLKSEYPDPKNCTFLSLDDYLKIAKRVISKFAETKQQREKLLSSEDYISEVARKLMMADWSYQSDKGRTKYSWRNNGGYYGVKNCINSYKKKANSDHYSLDMKLGEEESATLSEVVSDPNSREAEQKVNNQERLERIRRWAQWAMDNSGLTEVQKKCIDMKYVQGIDSAEEIAKMMKPRVSRQAVAQNIQIALEKIRLTGKGT